MQLAHLTFEEGNFDTWYERSKDVARKQMLLV